MIQQNLRKLSLCNYCYTTPAYPYMAIGAAPRAQGSWGCVRTAYLSDYSTEIFISWPKNMPDVPNVHARQTRLPRCKCDQHRRRRRRWYPDATGAAGHVEPLGSVAACAVFSSKPPKYPKLLHSICAPAFKDCREIMMATGHRAARVRTNAGESVGCIGLAPTGLLSSSFACSSDPGCKM